MTLEELNRDFKTLKKENRIEALKDCMRYFRPNKEGLYNLGTWYERELSLTFEREPDSNYYNMLLSYRQEMSIRSKAKFTSKKGWSDGERDAKEVFTRVMTFAS